MAAEELKDRSVSEFVEKKTNAAADTLKIPERFQDEDDADEDCTALSRANTYTSQSVFGMIAAAGPHVDYNARLHLQSSDNEEDETLHQNSDAKEDRMQTSDQPSKPVKSRTKFTHKKLLCSMPGLSSKSKSKLSPVTSPEKCSEKSKNERSISSPQRHTRHALVMSQTIEFPETRASPSSSNTMENNLDEEKEQQISLSLSKKLMKIFNLEVEEEVIEEYPCYLMNSILLQGYMYITKKHICFYAYLPKKSNEVMKSGYLLKSGRRNPKFHRYWFRLKGDVLSYYNDSSDLYFLRGNIDLRYGISAATMSKESCNDAISFNLITHQREYKFKADSAKSAKEWVKALQKIIFRSHNEGDSVKISLPIDNVIDIEESQIIDLADTCKIRVVDNGDTYAVDEYFFSFFSFGKEALSLLRKVVEDTTAQQIPDEILSLNVNQRSNPDDKILLSKRKPTDSPRLRKSVSDSPIQTSGVPILEESVRATLSTTGANTPRVSTETNRLSAEFHRKSLDQKSPTYRTYEHNKLELNKTEKQPANLNRDYIINSDNTEEVSTKERVLSESYTYSTKDLMSYDGSHPFDNDTHASGSQILRGSEVFLSPTIQHTSSAKRNATNENRSPSHETSTPSNSQDSTDLVIYSSLDRSVPSTSAPTLQSIVKVGAYPLQRAAGFAGYINKHSKRMSNLLATESIGYVEKVSGMWKGGKKHYDETHGTGSEDLYEDGENEDVISSCERFREHFSLPETEKLQAAYFGFLNRVLPLYGKIYISDRTFCFRSLLPATNTKLILPLADIENVDKEKGFRFSYSGLVIVIKGHEELFFEFSQTDTRDDCAVTLLQHLENLRYLRESDQLKFGEEISAQNAVDEHLALQEAHSKGFNFRFSHYPRGKKSESPPITFDDPRASILNFKPVESLRITCLTIGSRGDVQPYIALCKGLIAEGHRPRIATHLEFKNWVESYGIDFKPVSGDPAELMRICIENGIFTYSFLREASSKFRGWIDQLLSSAWIACQDSDLLIESPSAMGGIHIAEALAIPYFRAFTMPWTRTRAYPHAFAVPERKMGGAYNYITYVMFDNVFWKAIAGQVNLWRKKELGLHSTNLEKMQPNKIPFLYNFSPAVVVPPLDYSDWIRVTGYWFLDEGTNWTPPEELTNFIAKARRDDKKLVYIGFGSIVVQDSAALMTTIIKSVEKADIRCILSRGWSDRLDKEEKKKTEPHLPPSVIQIRSAPHDWLFNQIDAAAHHGGAGTTGASLRAGIPTIIKPFFGDQYFFGSRVEDLGVGITLKKLNVSLFSRALWQACNDERMIVKAKLLGKTIRTENGVETAIEAIYRNLDYAKSLIKGRYQKITDDVLDDSEESWTFIGEEKDPELVIRLHNWKAKNNNGPSTCNEKDDHDSDDISSQKDLAGEYLA